MLIACTVFVLLAVIPSGIPFSDDKNININILEEEFVIPTPKTVNTRRKGKTAAGLECFCFLESTCSYLPPVKNEECICKKNCCKGRPVNYYLPTEPCEQCPKCYCDMKTFTLINTEAGNCPIICGPPATKKCECRGGKYINEEMGDCPIPCYPPPPPPCRCVSGHYVNQLSGNCPAVCSPPPCLCVNGRFYNENSGNCPALCEPPPCLCTNGRYINEASGNCPAICTPPPCTCNNGRLVNIQSGNCPPCKPNCSCHKGKLVNEGTGVCPTACPYYYDEKPEGFENLPSDLL